MKLRTASETLSFLRELEEKEAKFFEEIAEKFKEKGADFLNLAKENRKFNAQIQMAYQSVITDAIEGCYAFDLDAEQYTFDPEPVQNLSEAVQEILAIEEKILSCYEKGREQSESLLADVPRNFKIVSRKRMQRMEKIKGFK